MEKILKQPLSAKAYQLLKEDIVTCVLDPGQFIVQTDLAEKYGLGVTPVREALRQLAHEGFVQSIPRLGYMVNMITAQDIQEIYEMRFLLETASVRYAAIRGFYDTLQNIAESANFTYTYKNHQTYVEFLNRNAEFHHSIAAATGNQRLADQVSKVLDELNRVFHLGLDLKDSAEEMRVDHVNLAEALCKRDADLAERLIQCEIFRSRERVMEALKKFPNITSSSNNLMGIGLQNRFGARSQSFKTGI